MTLAPVEPARMTIDPRRYSWCAGVDPSPVCEAPGCWVVWGLQKHHIVPRSRTGGPLEHITVDGLVVRNVCWLCREHHDQITGMVGGHRAAISWQGPDLTAANWVWCTPSPTGPLAFVSKLAVRWAVIGPLKGAEGERNARE